MEGDEEYGVIVVGANKLQFMCFNPNSNNNIMESKKRKITFKQMRLLKKNFELEKKLELEK
jgi:hypothetical protein